MQWSGNRRWRTLVSLCSACSGAAYTNPDRDPSTGTTLFDLDRALGVVAVQNPPNDGRLNTLMAIDAGAVSVGFDIGLTDFYAAFQAPGGTTSTLMARTGTERLMLGTIGGGEPVANLAVSFGTPFSPPVERVYGVRPATSSSASMRRAPRRFARAWRSRV